MTTRTIDQVGHVAFGSPRRGILDVMERRGKDNGRSRVPSLGVDIDDRLLSTALRGHGTGFQRLEILGDSVLDALIALTVAAPGTTASEVDAARTIHASDAALAASGRRSGLTDAVSRRAQRHLSDVVEATLGAAYLSGGWAAARAAARAFSLLPQRESFAGWEHPAAGASWIATVEAAVGCSFDDPDVLAAASPLSPDHRSLACVGTSVLEAAVTIDLFNRHAGHEGRISAGRAVLLANPRLRAWVAEHSIDPWASEGSSLPVRYDSADIAQAIVAAVAIDQGLEGAVPVALAIAWGPARDAHALDALMASAWTRRWRGRSRGANAPRG